MVRCSTRLKAAAAPEEPCTGTFRAAAANAHDGPYDAPGGPCAVPNAVHEDPRTVLNAALARYGQPLGEPERARLNILVRHCRLLRLPWFDAWSPRRAGRYSPSYVRQKDKARHSAQRAGLRRIGGALVRIEDVVVGGLYAAADYLSLNEHTAPGAFSCAELRALHCVNSQLKLLMLMPVVAPPCCFVRCELAAVIGGELDSEEARQAVVDIVSQPKLGAMVLPMRAQAAPRCGDAGGGARRRKRGVNIAQMNLRALSVPGGELAACAPRLAALLATPPLVGPSPPRPPPLPDATLALGEAVLVEWRRVRQRSGEERSVPAWQVPLRARDDGPDWIPATVSAPTDEAAADVEVRYDGSDVGVAGVVAGVPRAHLCAPWVAAPLPSKNGGGGLCGCCRWARAPSELAQQVYEEPTKLFEHALMPDSRSVRA